MKHCYSDVMKILQRIVGGFTTQLFWVVGNTQIVVETACKNSKVW